MFGEMSARVWTVIAGIIAVITLIITLVVLFKPDNSERQARGATSSQPVALPSSDATTALPSGSTPIDLSATPSAAASATDEPSDKILSVTAEIVDSYRAGPDRAASCRVAHAGACVAIDPHVLSSAGLFGYDGCYLSWTVYKKGSKAVFDAGSGLRCGGVFATIAVGTARTMSAGVYRLVMDVQTDSKQHAVGTYSFTLVDVSS
ncbi:hypothetical protein OG809_33970 [Kribbella soli]